LQLAVEKLERELREVCTNVETMTQNINDLTEMKFLLEHIGKLFDSVSYLTSWFSGFESRKVT
jgi:hypothetical protein